MTRPARSRCAALSCAALLALLCAVFATACACSREPSPAAPAAPPALEILAFSNGAETDCRFVVAGVPVEFAAALAPRLAVRMERQPQASTVVHLSIGLDALPPAELERPGNHVWLDGRRLGTEGGVLQLGDTSFGDLPASARVRIDPSGVFVGDALRGPLPPPLASVAAPAGGDGG